MRVATRVFRWLLLRTRSWLRVFVDFQPIRPSNQTPQIASSYRRHENEKRRVYERRVREIEHASFAPFVISCTRGIGPCATITLKRLGAFIAEKHSTPYSSIMGLLRCRLSFAMIRSSIMSIRGSRSSHRYPSRLDIGAADLAIAEGAARCHRYPEKSLYLGYISKIIVYVGNRVQQ